MPLPPDDPARRERAGLQERLAAVEREQSALISPPPHMRPAGWHIRDRELSARRTELAAQIDSIPVGIELPLAWWTLPPNHPHRALAMRAAAEVAARDTPEAPEGEAAEIRASLESLVQAKPQPIPTPKPFQAASRSQRQPRPEDMIEIPRSTGGTRKVHRGWPMCGDAGGLTADGRPCRILVWMVGRSARGGIGKPWSIDGRCWRHSADPRAVAARERWRVEHARSLEKIRASQKQNLSRRRAQLAESSTTVDT